MSAWPTPRGTRGRRRTGGRAACRAGTACGRARCCAETATASLIQRVRSAPSSPVSTSPPLTPATRWPATGARTSSAAGTACATLSPSSVSASPATRAPSAPSRRSAPLASRTTAARAAGAGWRPSSASAARVPHRGWCPCWTARASAARRGRWTRAASATASAHTSTRYDCPLPRASSPGLSAVTSIATHRNLPVFRVPCVVTPRYLRYSCERLPPQGPPDDVVVVVHASAQAPSEGWAGAHPSLTLATAPSAVECAADVGRQRRGSLQVGVCCDWALDSNNLCCETAVFDECGLCDGDSSTCATVGSLGINFEDANYEEPLDLLDSYTSTMAAVLEVNATRMAILGLNISGDYLDVDAWLANVTNATNAADGRDEGGRRRKLQQVVNLGFGNADTFLESDIKLLFKVDPPDEGDNIVVLVDDLLRLAVLGNVTQGTRKSVCGNRICESGETCHNDHYVQDLSAISGDRCCPLDCPLAVDTCPSSDNV
eukprot:1158633-Pyramimonas_sp.AAC.2